MVRITALCLLAMAYRPHVEGCPMNASESAASYLNGLVRDSRTPGIQYQVVAADRAIFEYAGGWADIAGRRPMNHGTTLMAYSMSKVITAAAMIRAAESGLVELDETVARYLDSPPYGGDMTIRDLLSHTSGIPNPLPLTWVHLARQHAGFDEGAALAAVLREHARLSFTSGTRYGYSNIGYWLLGRILERVTGRAFTSFAADQILRPLAIEPEELGYEIPDPQGHAHGYLEKYSSMNLLKRFLIDPELVGGYEGRWLQIRDHYVNGPAFGGLIGTARGFGKVLQDQLRPHSRLFGDPARAEFYSPAMTKQGKTLSVTLAWQIGRLKGVRFFYKEGGGGGFHCMMRVYPAAGCATVVMTNATAFSVRGLLDALDPRFFQLTAKGT